MIIDLKFGGELRINELLLTIDEHVATITFNRPQQRNAINYAMWRALPELCQQLEADANVRVIIWRGAGDVAFSAGGDISEFAEVRSNREQASAYNSVADRALESLLALGKPTLALVKGYCMGGGLMLAAHCDLRIAADNAQFGLPVANLGALITYPELQRFVHLIGVAATTDLLLTARTLDAATAHTIGLCQQVYPLATVDEQVHKLTRRMTSLAPLSQKWHKQMLQTILRKPNLNDITIEEQALLDACFDSADYREGTRAFLEKRPPNFQG